LTAGVCAIHLLRASFRYAGRQHWDAIAKALRPVYTAATEAAARARFDEFADAWGSRYPATIRLWEQAWPDFAPFLAFDTEIPPPKPSECSAATSPMSSTNASTTPRPTLAPHPPLDIGDS
jgi:transposase-like protein